MKMDNHIPPVGGGYAMDHPELTPLASQTNDRPALAGIRGMAFGDQNIINATVQCKRRKVLQQVRLATEDEVLQAKKREVKLLIDTVVESPIQQVLINPSLVDMQATSKVEMESMMENIRTEIRTEMNRMNGRLDQISNNMTQFMIQTAQNTNRMIHVDENLVPVLNRHGEGPPDTFPHTLPSMYTMDIRDVQSLLVFYEIPVPASGDEESSRKVLAGHIGMLV